jgi:hypothetical protein
VQDCISFGNSEDVGALRVIIEHEIQQACYFCIGFTGHYIDRIFPSRSMLHYAPIDTLVTGRHGV